MKTRDCGVTERVATAAFSRKPPPEGASGPKRVPYKKKWTRGGWGSAGRPLPSSPPGQFLVLVPDLGGPPPRPGTTLAH